MGDVLGAFWSFLVSIYPLIAVSITELVNFFSQKIKGSSIPGYMRYVITFAIAGALKFFPDADTQIDPETVTQTLTAFVTAVLALIKGRDMVKTKVTGDAVK